MLSLRINYSGDRTRKTHIMNLYCASLDLSHLLVFRDFQQVLSICLFSEDRRAQRLAQPWLTLGNPAVGADMLSTSATSVSSEELYLGRLSCLSRSPSCEKCPSVALPVTHHLQKSCQSSCLGVSSSSLAHSLWVWAAAAVRGTAWAVNSLTAGKHASLLLIFRCCMGLSIAGCRCRSRRVKQQVEHLHAVCLISLVMASTGLCWLSCSSTEASLKRLRMGTPSTFPKHTVGNCDGKKLKPVLEASLLPTLSPPHCHVGEVR